MGIQFRNEMRLDEMCHIMEELHTYVPTVDVTQSCVLQKGMVRKFNEFSFLKILFGGDQLTVARARGAQQLRANDINAVLRLDGVIPTIEDWHARQALMKV